MIDRQALSESNLSNLFAKPAKATPILLSEGQG